MLEMRQVSKIYRTAMVETHALRSLDLHVREGEFVAVTGPSGSGKTTFLKLAYAELMPTAGHVTIFDREVRTLTRDDIAHTRRRIGVVHQDVQFLDHLPLAANVALPLTVAERVSDPRDLADLLGWVGLGHLADAVPPSLSGGERQRAALARAIIMGPELVLADEPTGNLDRQSADQVMDLIRSINRTMSTSFLISTHDEHIAAQCPRRIELRAGRIVRS